MKSQEDKFKEIKNLSHDIQNILSTIVNTAQLLKQRIDLGPSGEKYVSIIENNSQRASEIIQEFLSDKKAQKRKIDTSILFDDIVSSFVNTLPADIEFSFQGETDNTLVYGNYSELYRALLNILVNAKEAINGEGFIEFRKYKNNANRVFFEIKDNGGGIPENIADKIFNDSFSTKEKGRESGMGLHIVKNIIEDHEGKIEVKSRLGEGALFIVELPVFIEDISSADNKKILIADDDNGLRESLADLFDSYGYKTLQAKDGNEVTELIIKNEFDLIIIDKKMPKKDGIKCISEIRKADKNLPIILVTGINLDVSELEELEKNQGANKIVQKPYDFIYLKEIVDKFIL